MNSRQRLPDDERKTQIMKACRALSERHGYTNIKRGEIAKKAKCSPALVSTHFGNMDEVRIAIMRRAIREGWSVILLQGLFGNDPIAKRAPKAVKEAAYKEGL